MGLTREVLLKTLLLLLLFATPSFADKSTDKRIVALTPAPVETIFALNAGQLLVGASEYSDAPEAAKKIPRVGAYGKPNLEKIIALKPTLVVTSKEGADNTSSIMKRTGIQWHAFNTKSAKEYPAMVRELGTLLDRKEEAEILATNWQKNWNKPAKPKRSLNVLLQLEIAPAIFSGGDTFLSEALTRCGHKNAAGHHSGYPVLSRETLVKLAPHATLILTALRSGLKDEAEKFWSSIPLKTPTAVLVHDPKDVTILGPRLPDVANDLCKALEVQH